MQVNLIAPPLFVVTTQTLERAEGIAKMNEAIEKIKLVIEERGGTFTMNMAVGTTIIECECLQR